MSVGHDAGATLLAGETWNQHAATLLDAARLAWERNSIEVARDHLRDLTALLRERPDADPVLLAASLSGLGEAIGLLGDHAAARGHLEEALALQRRLPHDVVALTRTLLTLGRTLLALDDAAGASLHLDAASQLLQQASRGGVPHPVLGYIKRDLGSAFAKLGRSAEALGSYEQALVLRRAALGSDAFPEIASLLSDIGQILSALGRHVEARARFEQALSLLRAMQAADSPDFRKNLAVALNNLGAIARKLDDEAAAVRYLEEALAIDPDMLLAAYNLFSIRLKQGNWVEVHRLAEMAYRKQSFVEERTPGADHTLLIINALDGNIPHENLVARRSLNRTKWFIEYASPGHEATLPRFDAVFNIIGDPDAGVEALAAAAGFHWRRQAPFLNNPARIPPTRRDRLPKLVAGVDDVVTAAVRRFTGETLRGPGRDGALAAAGLHLPLLLRQPGKHGGDSVRRVDTPEALAAACGTLDPSSAVYVTAFHDYASADKHYRKYRMIFVDRRPYPYHLAISPSWMVHYFSADMEAHPWKLDEERRFLEDPEATLGVRATAAIAAVARCLDLDYAGADFTLLPDGRMLLFEANATMLIHAEAEDGPLAHKNPHVACIFAAFDAMLDRALNQGHS